MIRTLACAVAALAATPACGTSEAGGTAPLAETDGAAGLRELIAQTQAACARADYAAGARIVRSLVPGKDQLAAVLVDDVPGDFTDKVLAQQHGELPHDDARTACWFAAPRRTQIAVAQATTEQLAARAAPEFPGGARKLAETVLRPRATFYEVEVVEPGVDTGRRFHLFFWDGAQWRMLGPAWRALAR